MGRWYADILRVSNCLNYTDYQAINLGQLLFIMFLAESIPFFGQTQFFVGPNWESCPVPTVWTTKFN